MEHTPTLAVLGGGAVGRAVACDCALAGMEDVRLVMRSQASLRELEAVRTDGLRLQGPQTNCTGFRREGQARLRLVTDDVGEAVRGAQIIAVCLPAFAQAAYFEQLIPHLRDGMVIHIIPDNYGALRLRAMMRRAGSTARVIVGGWNCAPFGVRRVAGADTPSLRLVNRFVRLKAGSFPMTDQAAFLESAARLPAFDCARLAGGIEAADTILDVNFSNLNPLLHIPATVLGVGVMENYGVVFGTRPEDFSLFSHAMCPAIARVQQQFLREQQAVAAAAGFTMTDYAPAEFFNRESVLASRYRAPADYAPFSSDCPDQLGIGPGSVDHRFLTEDVPMACGVMQQLARLCRTPTPLLDALCTLAEALVTDRQLLQSRAVPLGQLGLDGLQPGELRPFLLAGQRPEDCADHPN